MATARRSSTFRHNEARCRRLFAKHGIRMGDPRSAPDVPQHRSHHSGLARALDASLDLLESRIGARRRCVAIAALGPG